MVHRLWQFLGASARQTVNDVTDMPELPDKAGNQVLSAEGSSNTAISVIILFSYSICKFTGEGEGLCTEDSAVLSVYSGTRIIPRASSESLQRTWAKREPLRGSAEK